MAYFSPRRLSENLQAAGKVADSPQRRRAKRSLEPIWREVQKHKSAATERKEHKYFDPFLCLLAPAATANWVGKFLGVLSDYKK